MATFNENIRIYREKKGLNQEELALAMGKKSKNTVSGWENAKHDVQLSDLPKLCAILGVDVNTLLVFSLQPQTAEVTSSIVSDEVTAILEKIDAETASMSTTELKRYLKLAKIAKDEE